MAGIFPQRGKKRFKASIMPLPDDDEEAEPLLDSRLPLHNVSIVLQEISLNPDGLHSPK
jgi:hypothetical protein